MDKRIVYYVRFGARCIQVWTSIISTLAFDMLLGTLLISSINRGVFSLEVLQRHFYHVAIWVSSKTFEDFNSTTAFSSHLLLTQTRPTVKLNKRKVQYVWHT